MESSSLWGSLPLGPARPRGQECFCVTASPRASATPPLRPARSFATSATLRARLTADRPRSIEKPVARTLAGPQTTMNIPLDRMSPRGPLRVDHRREERSRVGSATRGAGIEMPRRCGGRRVFATARGLRGGTNKAWTSGPAPPPWNAALLDSNRKFTMCLAAGRFASSCEPDLRYSVNTISRDRLGNHLAVSRAQILSHVNIRRVAMIAWSAGHLPQRPPLVKSYHIIQVYCP